MLSDISSSLLRGSCNTPANSHPLTVHVDYLTVSFTLLNEITPSALLRILVDLAKFYAPPSQDSTNYLQGLENCFSLALDKPFRINDAQWHKSRIETKLPLSGGFTIYDYPDNAYISVILRFSGQWFDALDLCQQQSMFKYLSHLSPTCSRVDIALDDHTWQIIPYDEMSKAIDDANFIGFKKSHEYRDKTPSGEHPEHTLYCGSRNSLEYTRIYNHKHKCLRLEKELKGAKANFVFLAIVDADLPLQDFANFLAGHAIGSIDFVNRVRPDGDRETNLNRCDRLEFWQHFISIVVEGIKIKVERVRKTLESTEHWLDKQVSGSLFAFCQTFGVKPFLDSIFARHKMYPSVSTRLLIAALKVAV